jgi:hypothetical protein
VLLSNLAGLAAGLVGHAFVAARLCFRITLFALAAAPARRLSCIVVPLITVSLQVLRAAKANPVAFAQERIKRNPEPRRPRREDFSGDAGWFRDGEGRLGEKGGRMNCQ